MKRPSFQFYPATWNSDAKLRRCSWGARGVWIAALGLMHDADVYGLLDWPLADIASALGCPEELLAELVAKGVMRGCESGPCEALVYTPRHGRVDGAPVTLVPERPGPVYYSARLIRDEYVRSTRGGASRFDEPGPGLLPPDSSPDQAPHDTSKVGIGATPHHVPKGPEGVGALSLSLSLKHRERARAPADALIVDTDLWKAWRQERIAMGAPMTARAEALLLLKLADLQRRGYDPRAVIEQSIERRWKGLFHVEPNGDARRSHQNGSGGAPGPPHWRDAQREKMERLSGRGPRIEKAIDAEDEP